MVPVIIVITCKVSGAPNSAKLRGRGGGVVVAGTSSVFEKWRWNIFFQKVKLHVAKMVQFVTFCCIF